MTSQVNGHMSPLCSNTDPKVCLKHNGSQSVLTGVTGFLLLQGVMPIEDVLQIPLVV